MNDISTHTPTPWCISYGQDQKTGEVAEYVSAEGRNMHGIKLATPWVEDAWDEDPEAKANARFIVKAVNSHDELVAALEGLVTPDNSLPLTANAYDNAIDNARQALATARGTV